MEMEDRTKSTFDSYRANREVQTPISGAGGHIHTEAGIEPTTF